MIYILLISVIALLIIELKLRESFAAPSVIFLLSFLMASSLIFINLKNWDVVLSNKFLLYVFTAIFSFLLATHLTRFLYRGRKKEKKSISAYSRIAKPSVFLMVVSTLAFLVYVMIFIRRNGFSLNLTALLSTTYSNNVSSNGNSGGFLDNQMLKIVTAIAYITFYQLLLSIYVVKVKNSRFITFYNIILFLLVAVLSTDRNILLRFFIYGFVLWIMFFLDTNKGYVRNINFKIIRRAIIYGAIAMSVFYLFGQTKGYTSNFQRAVGLYGGSGLYNFNLYLQRLSNTSLQWGSETFKYAKNLLNLIIGTSVSGFMAFDAPIVYKSSTGFVYASNIYSSLRPFFVDFGYFGMIIFPFMLGTIFELLFSVSQNRKYDFSWVLYSAVIYPAAYFTISEQFFARIHLGSVYEIFWLVVFYIYIQRNIKFRVKVN